MAALTRGRGVSILADPDFQRTALAATNAHRQWSDQKGSRCRWCGAAVTWTGTRPRLWCSQRCRHLAQLVKPGFRERALEVRRASSARRRASDPKRCRTCTAPISGQGRRYCCDACLPLRTQRSKGLTATTRTAACANCSEVFTTRQPRRIYCSAPCNNQANKRRRYQAGSRRKFPRIRYSQRRQVLERDRWTCGICRAVIDPALRWPHPGSASIDHIDPSGAHEPSNWQAAHLRCNVEKGARAS